MWKCACVEFEGLYESVCEYVIIHLCKFVNVDVCVSVRVVTLYVEMYIWVSVIGCVNVCMYANVGMIA